MTGLSWSVFDIVCSYITPYLKLPRTNIPLRNQILMVLVQLWINLPFEYISHQAGISKSTANLTFHKILDLLYTKLLFLIHWQDRDNIRQTGHLQTAFSKIDLYYWLFWDIHWQTCKAESPSTSLLKLQKTQYAVKYLISCSPLGAIYFLSDGWGGRATDIYC